MKSLNVLLTISLALAAGVAKAQPPGTETTSIVVHFSDLNLQSPAGVAQLHARIRAAALEVCGSAERHSLRAVSYVRACTTQAVVRALASLDTPAPDRLASRPPSAR